MSFGYFTASLVHCLVGNLNVPQMKRFEFDHYKVLRQDKPLLMYYIPRYETLACGTKCGGLNIEYWNFEY